tara:strand:+ start:225 stop:446 length:222 start_codon:yes stop_codon:yes gene_type:complete
VKTYDPSDDKEIYEKCIGIARVVDNFSCSIQGDKIYLQAGTPLIKQSMGTALFFKMDANEIINMLQKEGGTHE